MLNDFIQNTARPISVHYLYRTYGINVMNPPKQYGLLTVVATVCTLYVG